MIDADLELPGEAAPALDRIQQTSAGTKAVLVLKMSPICGVSSRAESEVKSWFESRDPERELSIAVIDVIADRELARGLTAAIGIDHESPQVLLFREGKLVWHASHFDISAKRLASEVDGAG